MNFPAKAFAAEAIALIVAAVWARSRPLLATDISIHDTYFVLRPAIVCLSMASLLCLFAAVYSIIPLRSRYAAWHFWWTTLAAVGFWASLTFWGWLSQPGAAALHESSAVLAMALFVLSTFAFLVSPLMFIVNLGMALRQRQSTAHQ